VRLGIKAGDQYTRRQLLTAVLVKSSNDIAQALARDNAGSVEAFVAKMNAKCAELGLKNSHYVNPHGLPSTTGDDPYSTARELSVIAKACDQKPEIREIVKLQSYKFTFPNGRVTESGEYQPRAPYRQLLRWHENRLYECRRLLPRRQR
jgi:serine-type D-Ala-D-Ala carboxypeptidase (penicillin-binding protein 5/6)